MKQIFDAYRLIFSYIHKYPVFWLYFFLRMLSTAGTVSIPIIIGYIIVLLTKHANTQEIYFWILLLSCIVIINPIIDKISFLNGWLLSFRVAHDFRLDTVKKLRFVGLSFWQEHDKGNVMKIIDQAFEHITYASGSIIYAFVPFFGKIIGIFISTTFIDPVVGALLFVNCLFTVINITLILPKESEAGIAERKAQEKVYGRISEYLTNYKTVVYLNLFNRQEKEVFEHNEVAYAAYTKREQLSAWKWYFNSQGNAIFIVLTASYAIWQVMHGHLQLGLLTTILFFSLSISDYMVEGIWNISELVRYANSIKRYTDTFALIQATSSSLTSLSIDFQNLTLQHIFVQQKERETLQDISLTITKGDKIAIVGFTGSGKRH